MKYFDACQTIDDVKKLYRQLAKALHPDCGGSEAEFKEMTAEYHNVFMVLRDVHQAADGGTYTKSTTETPEQYAEVINAVIHLDGVKVEIVGSWVWVSGGTYEYRDAIKAAGFHWSKSKKAWYYAGDGVTGRRRGHYSMDGLRKKWGAVELDPEPQRKLA